MWCILFDRHENYLLSRDVKTAGAHDTTALLILRWEKQDDDTHTDTHRL